MPVNGSDVKVVYYTRSAYNNLSTKDDNTIYYVQETNGRLSLYIGTRAMGYANDSDVVKLSGNQTVAGNKIFTGANEFTYYTTFHSGVAFEGGDEVFDSPPTINEDAWSDNQAIRKGYADKNDRVKLLRARSGTNALTIYNDSSVTSVGSQLTLGDTIMFEVHTAATITSATPKILTATVSSTANSASQARSITFTTWTGSVMKVFSLSVARNSSGQLIFGNMNEMTMSKSGTNMNITNATWTTICYIGRIWKVDGSVL